MKQLLADMWETLAVAEGCGLAAPQIGKAIRLFIVDGTELAEDYPECQDFKKVFINPEIMMIIMNAIKMALDCFKALMKPLVI